MPGMRGSLEARFWAKVSRVDGGCWEWTAHRRADGYGHIGLGNRVAGKALAHRVSWEINCGPIPAGALLDHACHNRGCVNPEHLRLATNKQNAENLLDRKSKTGVRGVTWDKKNQKYRAQVVHNCKYISIGRFDTLEEAAEAARAKRVDLFTHNDADRRNAA